jgi:hypothetical protein
MTATAPYPTGNAIRKAMRRLLPFLLLMYVLSFLDGANIGFAQKVLQHARGLSDAAFAFGAGLFSAGYAVFEVPSNLMLPRVGALVWMYRIMVTWGLISAAMVAAKTPTASYTLRLLLGIFYFGAPLAFIFGGPPSGVLLELHGALGLSGWQWLFLVEGVLASAVGVWVIRYLDDKAAAALWPSGIGRHALMHAIECNKREASARGSRGVFATVADERVLLHAAICALIQIGVYGVIIFLSQQVASLLGTTVGLKVEIVIAVPWLCSLGVVRFAPRRADHSDTHRQWATVLLVIAGLCIALSNLAGSPQLAVAVLRCAASGFIAAQLLFWTFATRELAGLAAVGGIALISSLGGLGGVVAPMLRANAGRMLAFSGAGAEVLVLASFTAVLLIALVASRASAQAQPLFVPRVQRARSSTSK